MYDNKVATARKDCVCWLSHTVSLYMLGIIRRTIEAVSLDILATSYTRKGCFDSCFYFNHFVDCAQIGCVGTTGTCSLLYEVRVNFYSNLLFISPCIT